jgi:hypothetical protein
MRLISSFLLSILFGPDDGGDTFLRNVNGLVPKYMASLLEDRTLHYNFFGSLNSKTESGNFLTDLRHYYERWRDFKDILDTVTKSCLLGYNAV